MTMPGDAESFERVRAWMVPIMDAVTAEWRQLPRPPADRPSLRTMVIHEVHRRLVDVATRRPAAGDLEQAVMLSFAMLGARNTIEQLDFDDAERSGSE